MSCLHCSANPDRHVLIIDLKQKHAAKPRMNQNAKVECAAHRAKYLAAEITNHATATATVFRPSHFIAVAVDRGCLALLASPT